MSMARRCVVFASLGCFNDNAVVCRPNEGPAIAASPITTDDDSTTLWCSSWRLKQRRWTSLVERNVSPNSLDRLREPTGDIAGETMRRAESRNAVAAIRSRSSPRREPALPSRVLNRLGDAVGSYGEIRHVVGVAGGPTTLDERLTGMEVISSDTRPISDDWLSDGGEKGGSETAGVSPLR